MQTFLILVLIALMIATVVTLVRGIVQFLKNASDEARAGDAGPTSAALRSNQLMQKRILFQGAAILVVVLLLASAKS